MQRTRYKTNNMKYLYTSLKSIDTVLSPITHPKNPSPQKKLNNKKPKIWNYCPCRQWGKGNRGELSYVWTSMFHYIHTCPSRGLGTTLYNTECSKYLYTLKCVCIVYKYVCSCVCIHTHTPRHPPKQTKHLFYHCPLGNEGWGVWDIFHRVNLNFITIKYLSGHTKDQIQNEVNTKKGQNIYIH